MAVALRILSTRNLLVISLLFSGTLLGLLSLRRSSYDGMEFAINSLWNGDKLSHDPMKLRLDTANVSDGTVKVTVTGKFFNDPPAPKAKPGPTDLLWDYEVVEAFFLNSVHGTYMEVEFGPHGHHIVLLLQGRRNPIHTLLPMKYSATISSDRSSWVGEAHIPLDYFPPNVNQFNAFAIHGSDPHRQYEQLYAQSGTITQPDFHRLEDFHAIDFEKIIPSNSKRQYSSVWTEKMTPVK